MSSAATIYLGLDVHKDSVTIAVLSSGALAPTRVERLPNDLATTTAILLRRVPIECGTRAQRASRYRNQTRRQQQLPVSRMLKKEAFR